MGRTTRAALGEVVLSRLICGDSITDSKDGAVIAVCRRVRSFRSNVPSQFTSKATFLQPQILLQISAL